MCYKKLTFQIKVAALMAPVAYGTHIKGPLHDLAPYAHNVDVSDLTIFVIFQYS